MKIIPCYTTKKNPYSKYHYVLFLLYFTILSPLLAQESLFSQKTVLPSQEIPSHEAKIVMLATYKGVLYSLDSNGLLILTNKTTITPFDFLILSKKSIQSAKFSYPYIVFTTEDNTIYVYSLKNMFIVFSYKTDKNSVFTISPSLFAFPNENTLLLFSTKTWEIKKHFFLNSPPIHLAISSSEKNIMLYDTKGNITYLSIENTNILKQVATLYKYEKIILNKNKRYAVGFIRNKIFSLDLINGTVASSLEFLYPIKNIYKTIISDKRFGIYVVNEGSSDLVTLRYFTFLNDGALLEDDGLRINELNSPNALFYENTNLYIGFNDGNIGTYNIHTKNFISFVKDKTVANYDSTFISSSLLLANTDGIRSVTTQETFKTVLFRQKFSFPLFIPLYYSQNKSAIPRLLLSQETPLPLLFRLDISDSSHNINIQALFRLPLYPTHMRQVNTTLIAYSLRESSFYVKDILLPSEMFFTIPLSYSYFSVDAYEKEGNVVISSSIPLHIYANEQGGKNTSSNITTPLNNNAINSTTQQQPIANTIENTIYTYTLVHTEEKTSLSSSYIKTPLPFNSNTITKIRYMPVSKENTTTNTINFKEEYLFVILKRSTSLKQILTISEKYKQEILLVKHVKNKKIKAQNIQTILETKADIDSKETSITVNSLGVINTEIYNSLFIVNNAILFLKEKEIDMFIIDTENLTLLSKQTIPYPVKFSKRVEAHVSKNGVLSITDINNTVLVLQIDTSKSKIKTFFHIMIKDNGDGIPISLE